MFGRIIFNENANNNAYCTVPQDTHDFGPIHCEITGIFAHYGMYKMAILLDRFQRRACFKFFICFSFGSSSNFYYYLFIFIFLNTVAPSVHFQKDCFSEESRIEPWPNN